MLQGYENVRAYCYNCELFTLFTVFTATEYIDVCTWNGLADLGFDRSTLEWSLSD